MIFSQKLDQADGNQRPAFTADSACKMALAVHTKKDVLREKGYTAPLEQNYSFGVISYLFPSKHHV